MIRFFGKFCNLTKGGNSQKLAQDMTQKNYPIPTFLAKKFATIDNF